jgi:ABC-2 type transport system ATP-binding protein
MERDPGPASSPAQCARLGAWSSGSLPLRIRGLRRRYGEVVAVDRLDLEVRSGEILGFLGPNGAGKTTTLKVCAGLLRADAGEVEIAGAPLRREPRRAKACLGFVPDQPFLYERLSGRELLDFVAALYDVPPALARERAEAGLATLELDRTGDDLVETYSHGMRQKLAVIAASIHDPPLLMLDEPLGGLDPHGARALKDLLRQHAARGGGVLVSTHLLEVAERLCDRVAILNCGRLVAQGSLEELRGARHDATLEDVFLELTRGAAG